MNDSAMVRIGRKGDFADSFGKIWTSALGGCTGIAGVARLADRSVAAYVSHFDPMADTFQRNNGGGCLSERGMYSFMGMAAEQGEIEVADIVVAYDRGAERNPQFGERAGNYDKWYFLDQLHVAADQLSKREGVNLHFLPYDAWQATNGHELGVQVVDGAYDVHFDAQSFIKT